MNSGTRSMADWVRTWVGGTAAVATVTYLHTLCLHTAEASDLVYRNIHSTGSRTISISIVVSYNLKIHQYFLEAWHSTCSSA